MREGMCPMKLEIILWYYCRPESCPLLKTEAGRRMRCELVAEKILENLHDKDNVDYRLTDRGRAYVLSLFQVPFPIQTWVTEWPVASNPPSE